MGDLLAVRPRETAMAPKYERAAEAIRQKIRAGDWKPGQQLPTTEQLMADLDVSYGTLRSALLLLTAEGLIEGRQGEGRFVANPTAPATE